MRVVMEMRGSIRTAWTGLERELVRLWPWRWALVLTWIVRVGLDVVGVEAKGRGCAVRRAGTQAGKSSAGQLRD